MTAYVQFKEASVRFPSTGGDDSMVFYDEDRHQCLVVKPMGRELSVLGIGLKNDDNNFSTSIPGATPAMLLKVSPDGSSLAVQRATAAVV